MNLAETLARFRDPLLIAAAIVLVVISYFSERAGRDRRWFDAAFVLLGVLAAASLFHFGELRGKRLIHRHEQFHFFLGSKYLSEVRYDAIYEASILAVEDMGLLPDGHPNRRDPLTFEMQRGRIRTERAEEIRGRFTPERWAEFRRDAAFTWFKTYALDHGNTGSPAWGLVASAFTSTLRHHARSQRLFGALDLVLLAILFATAAWALGPRAAGLAMVAGLTVPTVFSYLGGSILRMDWIFALGMSVCLFHRRFLRSAGLFLGYAVASKLLAGIFVLPLGLRFLFLSFRRRSVDRDVLRYVLYATVGLAGAVVLSGLVFGFRIWPDYAERMVATFQEHYYKRNHSLRDVFLQLRHDPASLWTPIPLVVAASLQKVSIENGRAFFAAVQLMILVALGLVACRHRPGFAFALGPLAVFTALVSNRYYWQMWLLSALALSVAHGQKGIETGLLVGILLWIGGMQVIEMTPQAGTYGGYFGSYLLAAMIVILVASAGLQFLRSRRRPIVDEPRPAP